MQMNDWVWVVTTVVGTWIVVVAVILFVFRIASKDKSSALDLMLQEQVRILREDVDLLRQKLDNQSFQPLQVVETPYNEAINLARQGQPAQILSAKCGISRAEAELIVALHSKREASE